MSDRLGAKFERLVDVMRILREPGGCPWDREQTHASLRPFVLEETYEVLEAIDGGTPENLCEELGDFLFEAVFLARISEEQGDFAIADAVDAIISKLVRRHPHVFNREDHQPTLSTGEVLERWEAIKVRERAAAGKDPAASKTTLSGVPRTLPALLRAYEIGARASAVGFDWTRPADVMDKIEEEVAELRQEVEAGASGRAARSEDEMGDLLFSLVNLSRKLGIEPEAALRRANDTFTQRFDAMERALAATGRSLPEASLEEMEAEWQRVKQATRTP